MTNQFIEYIKIHLISLEQDMEDAQELFEKNGDYLNTYMIDYLTGHIQATKHLLSVANDMMLS